MRISVSKGQYVSKGLKRFTITVIDQLGASIHSEAIVGNKKTASNRVEKLKKEYKEDYEI